MEWRDIEGFPGYQVSDEGVVRGKRGWILKPSIANGYHKVSMAYEPWKFKCKMVHRLVAQAFVPNTENYPEVDHIDRNRNNNIPSNLRWATRKMNAANQCVRMTKPQLISEVVAMCKAGYDEQQIQWRLRDISSYMRLHEGSGRVFKVRQRLAKSINQHEDAKWQRAA